MQENFNYCENCEKQLKDEHKNKQLKNKDMHIFNKIEKPEGKREEGCIFFKIFFFFKIIFKLF